MAGGSETAAHGVVVRARRSMWAVAVLSVCLLAVAVAIFYSAWSRPRPFAPLGPFPEQTVDEPRDISGFPVVSLSHPIVRVTGEKCESGTGYQVTGTVIWQSMRPRGTSIRTGDGTRDAKGGCTEFSYRNDIPPDVKATMRRQLADGLHPLWRITGTETPVNDQGPGVPLTWTTEPFLIRP